MERLRQNSMAAAARWLARVLEVRPHPDSGRLRPPVSSQPMRVYGILSEAA